MENLEVILIDFPKERLDELVHNELDLKGMNIKSSHFYDQTTGNDLEIGQVASMQDTLTPSGSGNLVVKKLELGLPLHEVVIVFSFDQRLGDITFNFPDEELKKDNENGNDRVKYLLEYLLQVKRKYAIPVVRVGYEPATDDDTCLIELSDQETNLEKAIQEWTW